MQSLARQGEQVGACFARLLTALSSSGTSEKFILQLPPRSIYDEYQRFQLWSSNLGLQRTGHASLDYMLQDTELVRQHTSDLLEELKEYLDEMASIVSGQSIPFEEDSNDEDNPTTSELSARMHSVVDILDRLFNLATRIRNPTTRSSQGQRNFYKDIDREYREIVAHRLEDMEICRVREHVLQDGRDLSGKPSPDEVELEIDDVDEKMFVRLGRANNYRRQQFKHWRLRKAKGEFDHFVTSAHESIVLGQGKVQVVNLATRPDPQAPSSYPSSVTRIQPHTFDVSDRKSTISNITRTPSARNTSGEKVDWPSFPAGALEGKYFECPFCFNLCPDVYRDDAAWKAHLIHDLSPYQCTYESCTDGDRLYDSWADWISHESTRHNKIWRCLEHPSLEFFEKDAYRLHVMDAHSRWADHLLSPDLISARQSSSTIVNRLCPLCHYEEHNVEVMQKHLAFHLERIALLALPRSTGFEPDSEGSEEDEERSGRVVRGSASHEFVSTEGSIFIDGGSVRFVRERSDPTLSDGGSVHFVRERSDPTLSDGGSVHFGRDQSDPTLIDLDAAIEQDQFDPLVVDLDASGRPQGRVGAGAENASGGEQLVSQTQDGVVHWARKVFMDMSATPLPMSPMISYCAGTPIPYTDTLLDDYDEVLEVTMGGGSGLVVRLYVRGEDQRARIVCETTRPSGGRWYSGLPLEALTCHRDGTVLQFAVEETESPDRRQWCELKFWTMQTLVLFHGTFIALRSQDLKISYEGIGDHELNGENKVFAGKILDDGYRHSLCILYDTDSKAVRLLAAVMDGELKRMPVWTAFITHYFASLTWLRRVNANVVTLSELRCHIFSSTYSPQRTSTGAHVLSFEIAPDADEFVNTIRDLPRLFRPRP